MQKKQLKSLEENISKTQRIFENKKEKKECSEEKIYQRNLQRKSYMNRQIRGIMKSTGQGQKEIGDAGKEDQLKNKE